MCILTCECVQFFRFLKQNVYAYGNGYYNFMVKLHRIEIRHVSKIQGKTIFGGSYVTCVNLKIPFTTVLPKVGG